MSVEHSARIFHQFFSLIGVGQKIGHGATQVGCGAHLISSAMCHKRIRQDGEVLHVRAKQNRFPRENCLGRILPPAREQAFSDEGESGHAVPIAQFTGGIENQTFEERIGNRRLTSQGHLKTAFLQHAQDFGGPLGMAWGHHEKKIDKLPAQSAKDFGQDFFFARVGAAAKNYRAILQTKARENALRRRQIDVSIFRIVFDAADVLDSIRLNAKRGGRNPSYSPVNRT